MNDRPAISDDETGERDMHENDKNAEKFWEDLYAGREARPLDSYPNAVLATVLTGSGAAVPAGDALDLGCAEGADTVWLAQHGWSVLGVDVSTTALERTRARAEHAGVGGRVRSTPSIWTQPTGPSTASNPPPARPPAPAVRSPASPTT